MPITITGMIDFAREGHPYPSAKMHPLGTTLAWTHYWGVGLEEEALTDWLLSEARQEWFGKCSKELQDWLIESPTPEEVENTAKIFRK